MTHEPEPLTSDRTEARRRQILEAARTCVLQSGFHGSSMVQIAQVAGLSVGQIYRYFENKEAIIAAFAARDREEMRERFAAVDAASGGEAYLRDKSAMAVERSLDTARAAVVVEVVAEAARNPKVNAIVQAASAEELSLLCNMLRQMCPPEVSDQDIAARAEVVAALFDGLSMRSIVWANHKDGRPSKESLVRAVWPLMETLLSSCPDLEDRD